MAELAEIDTAPATIEASLNYLVDTGDKPFTYTGGPGSTDIRTGGTPDPHTMTIHNGRLVPGGFALERNGFRFIGHDTKMRDFFDEDEIARVYYPEMEALIRRETGASRVVVFDHTLRTADDEMREAKKFAKSCAASITTTPNGRGRNACAISWATKPRGCSRNVSPSCNAGGRSAIRSRLSRSRSAMRVA